MRLARPFVSTFVNRIDSKGRVSVPAKFRDVLESQGARLIYLRASIAEPSIEAGGQDWLNSYQDLVAGHDPTSELREDYSLAYIGDAIDLALDPEGRIVLPEILQRHAGLDEAAAFAGYGDHFRIWEPKALEVRMLKARRSAAEHRGQLRAKANGGGP